jgi:hypothetical protein
MDIRERSRPREIKLYNDSFGSVFIVRADKSRFAFIGTKQFLVPHCRIKAMVIKWKLYGRSTTLEFN